VIECNTNKRNTMNVSVFQTLWGGLGLWFPVYHPESTIVRRAPALELYKRVFLSLSPQTCTGIVPYVLPRSFCGWPRTSLHLLDEGHNHLIVVFYMEGKLQSGRFPSTPFVGVCESLKLLSRYISNLIFLGPLDEVNL